MVAPNERNTDVARHLAELVPAMVEEILTGPGGSPAREKARDFVAAHLVFARELGRLLSLDDDEIKMIVALVFCPDVTNKEDE